jgi:hypothetical protein
MKHSFLVLLSFGIVLSSFGQFTESENNNSKQFANTVTLTGTGGYTITGSSQGSATNGLPASTIDYFKLVAPSATPGVYMNTLTLTKSVGSDVYELAVRALAQGGGTITPGSDDAVQISPSQVLRWYSFGKAESIYVSVSGDAANTGNYTLTWNRSSVTLPSPDVIVLSSGQSLTWKYDGLDIADTDMWIYNSNFDPVADYGNDDFGGDVLSSLTRTYGVGTYYVAFSWTDLMNNQPAAANDDYLNGGALDFSGAVLSATYDGVTTNNLPASFDLKYIKGTSSAVVVPVTAPTYDFGMVFVPFSITIPLPVTITNLFGHYMDGYNQLRWTTATESGNYGFYVERSLDDRRFENAGFVPSSAAGGNSSVELQYTFREAAPGAAITYYRIRQADLDGRFQYSAVISIKSIASGDMVLERMYPNPAKHTVHTVLTLQRKSAVRVELFTMQGIVVYQNLLSLSSGIHTVELPVGKLAAGMYLVRISLPDGTTQTEQFQKE